LATRLLARPDGQIAYDDSGGNGPLVLCAPGMGDVRGLYRFLTPHLVAAGYRVVTMDLRGHGESTTGWPDHSPEAVGEDMTALLRHLGTGRPAVIVGESFTPSSAIWAAAEAPDLVAGIALCAPFFREQKPNRLMRALAALVTRSPVLWSDVFYRSLYKTSPPDLAAHRRALRANLRQPGRMAALRAMAHASKARANARLADVTRPVLVLMGTRDPDFADPADEARLAAGTARDGSVVMIEGAGHYPPAEMPEQTAAALLPFLQRTLAGHRAA
jgi:pimeloyl-ACP methyl ester carboxylesterase